jgi:hypothetical protein
MGTTGGTRQMAPGICFHPVYVNSHTQNSCTVNITNCRKKKNATPEDTRSAQHGEDVRDRILVHSRIVLCNFQGVIRTIVNAIEILAPLPNDELDFTVE